VEITDPRVRELPAGVPVEVRIDASAPPAVAQVPPRDAQ
jgi:hypothetical protein